MFKKTGDEIEQELRVVQRKLAFLHRDPYTPLCTLNNRRQALLHSTSNTNNAAATDNHNSNSNTTKSATTTQFAPEALSAQRELAMRVVRDKTMQTRRNVMQNLKAPLKEEVREIRQLPNLSRRTKRRLVFARKMMFARYTNLCIAKEEVNSDKLTKMLLLTTAATAAANSNPALAAIIQRHSNIVRTPGGGGSATRPSTQPMLAPTSATSKAGGSDMISALMGEDRMLLARTMSNSSIRDQLVPSSDNSNTTSKHVDTYQPEKPSSARTRQSPRHTRNFPSPGQHSVESSPSSSPKSQSGGTFPILGRRPSVRKMALPAVSELR